MRYIFSHLFDLTLLFLCVLYILGNRKVEQLTQIEQQYEISKVKQGQQRQK